MSPAETLRYASRVRPCKGERVSGDAAVIRQLDDGLFVAIIDVLGHGPEAHELTPVIEGFLDRYASQNVAVLMTNLHQHLKGTRGAAAGFCAIDSVSGRLTYVGVGNTSIRRFGATETRLVSQDGVVGHTLRTLMPQTLALADGDLVVLYTDGVSDRFTAAEYPSVLHHAAEAVAGNIVQRFGKDHDDATCIAVRYQA